MRGRRIAICAPRKAIVEEFEVPATLAPGEVLLEIAYSLISPGTELGAYNAPTRRSPYYPGYTAVGTVRGVGPGAEESLVGQWVFLFPAAGDSNHCHATHKVVQPGALLLPLPNGLDPPKACFARMVNIALTPYCLADPKVVGSVLVVGLGLVGNLAGQVGRIRGYRTIGLDPNASRRRRAQEAGFDAVLDPTNGDPVVAVRLLTQGQGANLTVNATGRADTFPMSLEATAPGGEVSTLGGSRHAATADLNRLINVIHTRHLTLRGGWEMNLPRTASPAAKVCSTEENLRLAFRWLAEGAIRLDPIWTHIIRPDQFPDAYEALNRLDDNTLGVIVDWQKA